MTTDLRKDGFMRTQAWWKVATIFTGLGLAFVLPVALDLFAVVHLTTAAALALLALSLGLVWGYGGILCLGQTAFFGLGAYAYAIAAINLGNSAPALVAAVLVPVAFAAVLGWFVFHGRVNDVYLAVITLAVTLILYNVLRRTSGPEFRIGDALLGGFNGIAAPALHVPWTPDVAFSLEGSFQITMVILVLAYAGCVWLLRTPFGRVVIAVRENPLRAELLGYDVRLYRLGIFMIGGGLAGLGGALFAASSGRITPDLFDLYSAALPVIWVIAGGRGTLAGPVLAAFALFYLISELGAQQSLNSNLLLGVILIVFVLLVPRGIVPEAAALLERVRRAFRTGSVE